MAGVPDSALGSVGSPATGAGPGGTAPLVLEAEALGKVFGRTVAVEEITLAIGAGEVFGLLGPNGAGKTTTVKMLLGLIRPSSGSARILGRAPGDPAAMARVGFLPEHFRFPAWLTAEELLETHARLCGIPRPARRRRVTDLLEMVGLAARARSRIGDFSKGMAQRLGLAQAILNDPAVVFLDEPTSGLDPLGRRDVLGIIRGLRRAGVTVLLNSHVLGEVEATCDRVAIVKRGRVARLGSIEELTGAGVEVEVRAAGIGAEALRVLGTLGTLRSVEDGCLVVTVSDREAIPEIARALVESGARVHAIAPRRVSLEELFLRALEDTP